MHPKVARADHDILSVIRERWSPRSFDPARPVSRADLSRLFEAARWAPSSMNEQPWRFVAACGADSEAHQRLLAALKDSNRAWAAAAPVLVLASVLTTATRTGETNRHAMYDTGQAVGFLTLQATSMGLGVRQMEGFDHEAARRACEVPDTFEPAVVMAIGYPGKPEGLTLEAHRDMERRPRARRAIGEFVYEGVWGRAFNSP